MANDERAEPIGTLIRQLRRQRNITQTQLGAMRYSKSYVSAVEKNIIRPSSESLEFFAEQLDQPRDYFTSLLEASINVKQELHTNRDQSVQIEEDFSHHSLLNRIDHSSIRGMEALPTLASGLIAALSPSEQASYFFLDGLMALEKQEHEMALHALERALSLASAQLRPAVLDALGQHYYQMRSYTAALHYHHRAFVSLQETASPKLKSALLFPVALHCGEDYRVLGAYTEACDMYECAWNHLYAEHDKKSLALLYRGWGYCSYALTYTAALQGLVTGEPIPLEEMERGFQRATHFAVQSRDISHTSGDSQEEVTARLLEAVIELDFSMIRSHLLYANGVNPPPSCTSLLDEAEKQCWQVLESYREILSQPTTSQTTTIYIALAYLVRSFIQRAILARLSEHNDAAWRERRLAAYLCQHILDTLKEQTIPRTLLQEALSLQTKRSIEAIEDASTLLHLPILTEEVPVDQSRLSGVVEVYRAAGEVAEELSCTTASVDEARTCYMCADRCFHTILTFANALVSSQECDPGYLMSCQLRYAWLLEERSAAAPGMREETSRMLMTLLRKGLSQVQNVILSAQLPHARPE